MEVAQGHVSDRPFARTVYAVAAKHFTGDLVLQESGRNYKVSWEDGKPVAAESASPADSAGRIALSAGLVTSTHVSRSLEIMAQTPGQDALEVLTTLARLSGEQVVRLKRRLLAHRAARIFALADARFSLDNARSLRADPDVPPLDARWLINFGLRTHYTIERLEKELAPVATRGFTLAVDAVNVLPTFGFEASDRPVLERLRQRGWSLQGLVDASRDVDRRVVLSIVYALMASDCLEPASPGADAAAAPPPAPASPVVPAPAASAAAATSSGPPLAQGTVQRIGYGGAPVPAGTRQNMPPLTTTNASRSRRASAPPPTRRANPTTVPPELGDTAADETRSLIASKVAQIDTGADHFAVLGVPRSASAVEVRTAYFGLAKRLHPDRLQAVGVDDMANDAQRLFARINQAFGVLNDPQKRQEYLRVMTAGGEDVVNKAQAQAEEAAIRALRAEEAYRMGEMALRRNNFREALEMFDQAAELQPEEAEYLALSAWATWLCAEDKVQVSAAVQRRLSQAIARQPKCIPAHFYAGQVAKQSGRTQAAIESFKQVVELNPNHPEANLELRVLLSRERKDPSTKSSLLDKLKKPR
ncbi:MAG TPA: DnaJ domain-containing protein [Kofleriaceae bacterium]|nr:DnaJ domain-containing protein [Kofleriaceae bacterium]